jgi:uncharacterized protein (TIGR03000 family)
MSLRKTTLVALVAVTAMAVMADSASAWGRWRGSWGSGGSWGGRGSHGSWGSRGSWGGSHGSWGGSHGSWGGSHGGWGSNGSYGGYGGGYGGGYAVVYRDHLYARNDVVRERVIASDAKNRAVASAPAVKTSLTLHVPSDAKVTLAGVTTKQSGELRKFSTTRLNKGQIWDGYKVVVEMDREGQTLREERIIKLTGGQAQDLTINLDSTQIAQR